MKVRGEIPADECWRLLATAHIGRLALSSQALPRILPVQYYVDNDLILLCPGSFRVSERSAHGAVVAFAADDIDPAVRHGWSVHAVGRATFDYHERTGEPNSCGEQTAGQLMCFEPDDLSGRWVDLCPFIPSGRFLKSQS